MKAIESLERFMVSDETVDAALFSQADEDTGMLIDLMGMGSEERWPEARRIMKAAMEYALLTEPPKAKDGSAELASRLHNLILSTMDIPDHAVEAAMNYRVGRATLDAYITWPGGEMRGNLRQFVKMLVLETLRAWK